MKLLNNNQVNPLASSAEREKCVSQIRFKYNLDFFIYICLSINVAQLTWIAISSEFMVWREIKMGLGQHVQRWLRRSKLFSQDTVVRDWQRDAHHFASTRDNLLPLAQQNFVLGDLYALLNRLIYPFRPVTCKVT